MDNPTGGKTIAKNTAFLYVRMLIIMVVTLYTSRVILQVLGIDDFGLYQTVGGVVGFLAFISNALAGATSRFITYALGKNDIDGLKRTFSTTLTTHLIIGLFIVVIAETIGFWYVYNKMVIPEGRMGAALWVYHISIITAFIAIIQVPLNAEVIAHEKMTFFAYIGIIEAFSKLGIVYLLSVGGVDRLVMYALLLFLVQTGIYIFNFFYCKKHFVETIFHLFIDNKLFKEIFSFSGWSLFANGAIALSNQGILLLLNLFFAPSVVTARSISLQVNNVASQFVQNFRTAANPQIVKRYASGDFEGSKRLLLELTKFSYYLMLLIALPLCLLAEPLLNIWLVEVPDYTVAFLQIVIVQSLFQVFDTSFFTALYAKGRIKENALVSPLIIFLCFPIVYLLFRFGSNPLVLSWAYLIAYALLGLVIKPVLIHKIVDYAWQEIFRVIWSCFLVTIVAVPVPLYLYLHIGVNTIINGFIVLLISLFFVVVAVWFMGMSRDMKDRLLQVFRNRMPF